MLLADTSFSWPRALLEGSGWEHALLLTGTALLLFLAVRAHVTLHRRPGRTARLKSDGQAGTATMEFTLVFPIILFLTLLLLQVTFAMVGNMYVHYAAFAATRSAIVYIPAEDPGADTLTGGDARSDRIRAAAVWALTPICGRLDSSDMPGSEFVNGLDQLFAHRGDPSPNWVENYAAQRLNYADQKTQVNVLETTVAGGVVRFDPIGLFGGHEFGPRDPVTVQVVHDFNLSIPYVRGIFSDGTHNTADGEGAYAVIEAQYTLTNEGITTELPPLPDLPRDP